MKVTSVAEVAKISPKNTEVISIWLGGKKDSINKPSAKAPCDKIPRLVSDDRLVLPRNHCRQAEMPRAMMKTDRV